MKNIDTNDSKPGTPKIEITDSVKIFIGMNIFNDETITLSPYNNTNAKITLLKTVLINFNNISFL